MKNAIISLRVIFKFSGLYYFIYTSRHKFDKIVHDVGFHSENMNRQFHISPLSLYNIIIYFISSYTVTRILLVKICSVLHRNVNYKYLISKNYSNEFRIG